MSAALSVLFAVVLVFVLLVVAVVVVLGATVGRHVARANTEFALHRFARIRLSDAYDQMKTGDLIYMFHNFSFGTATGSLFTHAAVVVRADDGRLLLSESVPQMSIMPDPRRPAESLKLARGGSRLSPMLPRLKYYAGHSYWAPLERPLGAEDERALRAAAREYYPYPGRGHLVRGALGVASSASRHCFQHVGYVLDCAGCAPAGEPALLSRGYVEVLRSVSWIGGKELKNGNRFAAPLSLLYDLDC
jgi:hypothetical protein